MLNKAWIDPASVSDPQAYSIQDQHLQVQGILRVIDLSTSGLVPCTIYPKGCKKLEMEVGQDVELWD